MARGYNTKTSELRRYIGFGNFQTADGRIMHGRLGVEIFSVPVVVRCMSWMGWGFELGDLVLEEKSK